MLMGATKLSLHIAVAYASTRLTVGAAGASDTRIMDYQLQQNALLPLVARAYVLRAVHTAWGSVAASVAPRM